MRCVRRCSWKPLTAQRRALEAWPINNVEFLALFKFVLVSNQKSEELHCFGIVDVVMNIYRSASPTAASFFACTGQQKAGWQILM